MKTTRRTIKIQLVTTDEMPESVKGVCGGDDGSGYLVVLNGSKTPDEQALAFLHECLHIYHGDSSKREGKTADQLEKERNAELKRLANLI